MASLVRVWYTYTDVAGVKHQRHLDNWYAEFPKGSKPRRVPLHPNKKVAQQMLADLEREREQGRGAASPARTLLADEIPAWAASMASSGVSEKQRDLLATRVRKLLLAAGATTAARLDLDAIEDALDAMQAAAEAAPVVPGAIGRSDLAELLEISADAVSKRAKAMGIRSTGLGKAQRYSQADAERIAAVGGTGQSNQTVRHYVTVMKQFAKWLGARRRLLIGHPIHTLKVAPTGQLRHDRRALDASEVGQLLAAAAASDWAFRGLDGTDRRAIYLTALYTGFRAEELGVLTVDSFRLDQQLVVLGATQSKNGRAAEQPIPAAIAGELQAYLAKRRGVVWRGTWWERAADMIRPDLQDAGIPYAIPGPDGPLHADFHALRHTFVCMLHEADVPLSRAMQLARHSDPKLTTRRYGKAKLAELRGDVDRLPIHGGVCGGQETPRSREKSR